MKFQKVQIVFHTIVYIAYRLIEASALLLPEIQHILHPLISSYHYLSCPSSKTPHLPFHFPIRQWSMTFIQHNSIKEPFDWLSLQGFHYAFCHNNLRHDRNKMCHVRRNKNKWNKMTLVYDFTHLAYLTWNKQSRKICAILSF